MSHNLPLISTVASALGLALMMGLIAVRCKLPTIVGYLLAGIIIGPFTPGFVADSRIASELADIGVMLLMFGVGLHFSLHELLNVRHLAIPGAIVQIITATLLGTCTGYYWGWPLGSSLIFGLSLSVASTVVLIRTLETRHSLESINGRIAVGWLVVEDLAMVIVLILLPSIVDFLHPSHVVSALQLWQTLSISVIKIAGFIGFMSLIGKRIFPEILRYIARTGSHELFTLCIAAAAVSIAFVAAKLFGISFALGAFFAGTMLQDSKFSERAAEESLPLREAFTVLFFVAMGMLFDPMILIQHPLQIVAVVSIIIFGKSLAAYLLVLALHYRISTALTVSASLAQIGEFSFILAELGVQLGILSQQAQSLIIAGALISITLNPLVFRCIHAIENHIPDAYNFENLLEKNTNLTALETKIPLD